MEIKGSVALIVGGASGLGEATARLFVARGARGVVVLDRDAGKAERLVGQLGETAQFIATDITDPVAVQAALDQVAGRFGGVHAVVNTAAIALPGKLIGRDGPIPMAKFEQVIKVNLYGALHVLRAAVPLMMANEPTADGERGVVIHVSSGAAYEGQVGQIAYSASKAALNGMTMPLARELASYGIRVVSVAPGAFDTPIYETVPPAVKAGLVKQMLFPRRMGLPSEFAHFAAEIVENSMHNGRTYRFDAGVILSPNP